MAAYAALASLMNTMEQIQNHTRHSTVFDKKLFESLQEKVCFFQDFVESYSQGGRKASQLLECQIASAAYAAEDAIESHLMHQILAKFTAHGKTNSNFSVELQKVIKGMNTINKKVMKIKEERGFEDQQPTSSTLIRGLHKVMVGLDSVKRRIMKFREKRGFKDDQPTISIVAASSKSPTTGKNTVVEFDDHLIQLMEGLIGQQTNRQTIPIIGMGGIGKTTLARNAYENLVVVEHFDIRAWATISHEYSVRKILLQLLVLTNDKDPRTDDQLGEQLYKSLSGKRYLIILDDIWSIEVWDKLKFFFPDNNSGSRIIVTTRLSNVAMHFGSSCFAMNFLDEDKSWNLFCEKAFEQEGCPCELEEIGKKIAKKCKGLPLSIVVIGGLLRKSSRTQECWENVAKDINSILNSGENEQCLDILSLSYSQLPAHLKPCFLYMGSFPEDHEIRISGLIKLWVAEGFLRPNETQSLEEVAKDYLKDLIDRNLILVRSLGSNGKVKTCGVHDLLRDLCLRISKKEKFRVMRVLDIPFDRESHIVLNESNPQMDYHPRAFLSSQSASHAPSRIGRTDSLSLNSRLLRVLNVVDSVSLESIFQQINLRYLAYEHRWISISQLPSSISLLWNVQTLIIRGGIKRVFAPSEIWYMPQLRHIEFHEISLPDPPSDCVEQHDGVVLRNLQTLLKVVNCKWSEEVCKRILNVKKLHIKYDNFSRECEGSSYYFVYNLALLHKLESLNCAFFVPPKRGDLLLHLAFPSSLQTLTLKGCKLHWEDLTMIGSLPYLEVLKLENNSFVGREWNPVEGEFLRLKFLKIDTCGYLKHWNADSCHFPVLEKLVLYAWNFQEIPYGIGEIPTLRVIRLSLCPESAAISAMKILKEQESFGNEGLQVQVTLNYRNQLENLKKEMEIENFTSKNFQARLRGSF